MKDGFLGSRSIVLPPMMRDLIYDDMLLKQLYITDIGYFPQASMHIRERESGISENVLLYCVKGKGWYSVNGKRYELSTNQYTILPSGVSHSYGASSEDPWSIYWIHFAGDVAQCYVADTLEPRNVRPEIHSRITNRINAFEEIYATLKAGYSFDNLRYASSLLHYFLGSLRFINQYRAANSSEDDNTSEIMRAAIHYLDENKEKSVSLRQLSDFTGFSISYLSKLFREHTGYAPLTYFNILKIREACYLMDNTDMKIVEISNKIGFKDLCYFSRVFKKIMDVSPKQYRKLR